MPVDHRAYHAGCEAEHALEPLVAVDLSIGTQVVDRDPGRIRSQQSRRGRGRFSGIPGARCGRDGSHFLRFEVGDLLPQHGNEIAHHVNDGPLDAEQESVQIALRHPVADLAGQPGIELVLGHRFEQGAAGVRLRRLQIDGHVHGLRGDRDLVDLLPRHLEVRSSRSDDPDLRVGVARPLLGQQLLGDGLVESGFAAGNALRAPECRFDGALILIHRVDTHEEEAHDEPGGESE